MTRTIGEMPPSSSFPVDVVHRRRTWRLRVQHALLDHGVAVRVSASDLESLCGQVVAPSVVVVGEPDDVERWSVEVAELRRRFVDVRVLLLAERASMDALCASRCADLDGIVARDAPSDVLAAAVRAVGLGLVVSDGPLVPRRSAADPAAATATLSMRERQVLAQVATGASNAAIAHCLVVSTETVKSHVAHILAKLGVPSRAAAVDRAIELGALASVGAEIVPQARTAPASR